MNKVITEQQKIEIKEFAAIKPIAYDEVPSTDKLKKDCIDYALNVFPEWNVHQVNYFYHMIRSYTPTIH